MNNVDGNTQQAQAACLALCRQRPGATGCEVIWHKWNRGCYAHTQTVARGNGVARHMCWIFSKCSGRDKLFYSDLHGDRQISFMIIYHNDFNYYIFVSRFH